MGMVADARDFFQQQSVQAEFPEAGVRHIDLHGRIQIAGPDCVDVIQGFVELRERRARLAAGMEGGDSSNELL